MANVDMLTKAAFGQYGSTLLNSTDVLYVIAITMITSDVKFAALETLGGKIAGGISTVTAENDLDNTTTGIGASDNGDDVHTSNDIFPAGLTIYGKWDKVDLGAGKVICYFAPKGY